MSHAKPSIAMEGTCESPAEAPFPPLRQAQFWHCVHGAHRDMAPKEFQEFLGALGPPPMVLQPPKAERPALPPCSTLDTLPDSSLQFPSDPLLRHPVLPIYPQGNVPRHPLPTPHPWPAGRPTYPTGS